MYPGGSRQLIGMGVLHNNGSLLRVLGLAWSFMTFMTTAHSQGVNIYERLESLTEGNTFPEALLKTKTAVLYKVSPKPTGAAIRGDWQSVAEVVQPYLQKTGIDGIVHYYMEDIFSGPETYDSFLDHFDERDIKNALFVLEEKGTYELILTNLTDRQNLIKMDQPAWKRKGTDLPAMLNELYRAASNAGLVRENRLVLGVPEYGGMISPIKARRNEFYDLNFSSETLAVPMFADTSQINAIMASYPYKYDFIAVDAPEKELRSKGFQYILYYVESTGRSVKEMLGYKTTESETDYISEVVRDGQLQVHSNNVHTPVYKFYIKHIYSGNVFLGKKWDSSPQWQNALDFYIANLRNELVKN